MSFHRSFQHHARYNVLTPAFLLAALALSTPAWAQETIIINDPAVDVRLDEGDSLINNDLITRNVQSAPVRALGNVGTIDNYDEILDDTYDGISIAGDAGRITNHIDAKISGLTNAVLVEGKLDVFENFGNIVANTYGIQVGGDVKSFLNAAGATISSVQETAVWLRANVEEFTNIGTITSINDWGVYIAGSISGAFRNDDTITGGDGGVGIDGSVDEFTNSADATISGDADTGVYIGEGVRNFTNHGVLSGDYGVWIVSNADDESVTGRFENTKDITGTAGHGIYFEGSVNDFENSGTIKGGDRGVEFDRDVKKFLNAADSTIEGGLDGVYVERNDSTPEGNASFENAGTIEGKTGTGVYIKGTTDSFINYYGATIKGAAYGARFGGKVTIFENHGNIVGDGDSGVYFEAGVGSFLNSGNISTKESEAVSIQGSVDSFVNRGTIKSEMDNGVEIGTVNSFKNYETIIGSAVGPYAGLDITGASGAIENYGTIKGNTGVQFGTAGQTLINAGRIEAGAGGKTAIAFNGSGNILDLRTGAFFKGYVDFGDANGDNTLDVSQYRGTIVMDVTADTLPLGNVIAGNNLVYQLPIKVVVTSASGVRHSSQPVTTLAEGVSGLLAAPLAETATLTDDQAFGYAPGRRLTDAELATGSALSQPDAGYHAWGTALGGGSYLADGDAHVSSLYGGLVVGAHAAVSEETTIGLIGGYARSTMQISAGDHKVDADTGLLGIYGETRLDMALLNYALLGGLSANASERRVDDNDNASTASASFGGWWLAPEVSASIPVLSTADGELRVGARVGYIGGGFAGYTETGSMADLTVSAQTFGLLNAAIEVSGDKVLGMTEHGEIVASASLGLFSQTNVGGSDVSVSLPNFTNADLGTLSAATGTSYGVKLGGSLSVPVAHNVDLSAGANGLIRNDGFVSAGANVKLSGSF